MRESTAIINTLTEYKFSILASKHQKHQIQTTKFRDWTIELTFSLDFRKNLASPDTQSQAKHNTRNNNKENNSGNTIKYKLFSCKRQNFTTIRMQVCSKN